MLKKGILFFLLLYVVDELHFKWSTGIPAVAPVNLIFLVAFLATRGPDSVQIGEPRLKKPLMWMFAALGFGFLWAQVRAPMDFINDLTVLKNAVFYPLFYFLFLHCKEDEKTVRWLAMWIMIVAAVAGLEAIHEGIGYGLDAYNPFKRASGPFGEDWRGANAAGVAYAMSTPMFVAFALFLRKKKIVWIGSIGGIVLLAGGTLFTYSRQSYFIVLFTSAVLLVRRSIVVAAALGVVLVSLVGYLPDTVTQRVQETKQEGKHGSEEVDESTSSRWEIWAGAMEMSAHNPIGVGLDRFRSEIGAYSSHKGFDAHNFYVRTLAEYGPQGLAAVLFLIYSCLQLGRFLEKNLDPDDPYGRAFGVGFTVTVVATALGNIYGSRFLDGAIMAPYWSMAGLLERYAYLQKKTEGSKIITIERRDETLEERFPLTAFTRRRKSSSSPERQ